MANSIELRILAGAGGGESEAWAAMLLRMYLRWIAKHGLSVAPGRDIQRTEHGIKSAILLVQGVTAQNLRSEAGVHRMVRISPLDAEGRRHTSFASVQIDDDAGMPDHWVHQIRSYVFHPYTLVKDLRTAVETNDIQSVMDGEIDDFLTAAIGYPLPYDPNAAMADSVFR